MPDKVIPFQRPPRRQAEPEPEAEPFRVIFEIGEDRLAIDVTTSFMITELPSGPGRSLRFGSLVTEKGHRRF